jgi:IS4 transposase
MDTFQREALRRLPLAEAAYLLLDHVTDAEFLAGVFQRHGGASYEKVISFPLFVHLVTDALLQHHGSGHQSFTRAHEDGTLAASPRAVYGKLARVPLSLSRGLLAEATQRLRGLCPPVRATPLPDSLRGFTVLALDGKKVKHVARRLKVLRRVRGQVLAAKLAVALDYATGLAVAMAADPDGEVSDAPLVPGVLAQVRAQFAGPLLWVEDRQFCDLNQPRLVRATGDHYLIRYNAKVGFHPDPSRPAAAGRDACGRCYREAWGWLGSAADPRRQYVRRITLERPGEEAVILVTDLTDADAYPAADLLEVYRQRWGIERVFQRITEVFHLQALIGSTPPAGVFQAAFCLLLYNLVVVLRGYLGEAQRREPEAISTENLFTDVQRQVVALHEVLSAEEVVGLFTERRTGGELRRYLRGLLAAAWSDRWLKAQAKPPKRPAAPEPTKYLKGGHTSVYRLLQGAHRRRKAGASARK